MNKENEKAIKVLDIIKSSDKVELCEANFVYKFFSRFDLKYPRLSYDRKYYVCHPSGIAILFLLDYYGCLRYVQVLLPGKKLEDVIIEKKLYKIRKTLESMYKEEKATNALQLLLKLNKLKQR